MGKILLITVFICSTLKLYSQIACPSDMDSTKYVHRVIEQTKSKVTLWLVINIKTQETKTVKMLITNFELSLILKKNFDWDTTFSHRVEQIFKNHNGLPDTFKIDKYKVNEEIYAKFKRLAPCKVYKKYFNKKGFPNNRKSSHEEFRAVIAYLVDNYAIISTDHFSVFSVIVKPLCAPARQ